MSESINRGRPNRILGSDQLRETTHRVFFDTHGIEWKVWEVNPSSVQSARRRLQGFVEPSLEMGWLCFESSQGEKRRLTPVPSNWERFSFHGVIDLWRLAIPVRKPSA